MSRDWRAYKGNFQRRVQFLHSLSDFHVNGKTYVRSEQDDEIIIFGNLRGFFWADVMRPSVKQARLTTEVSNHRCRVSQPNRIPITFYFACRRPARTRAAIKLLERRRIEQKCFQQIKTPFAFSLVSRSDLGKFLTAGECKLLSETALVILALELQMNAPNKTVEAAYAFCQQMAESHYENFPVGSVLIPKHLRKHVYSIYAFARTADDFADEGCEITDSARLASLEDWRQKLESCFAGEADHPVFIALAATVRELNLPKTLFTDLLSAFKQDVVKRRYANFDEVLDYCTCSANPVGRLILLLFGYRDERLFRLSDHICTALQLANFWQDVSVDIGKDRIYLPQDELARFGVSVEDLREARFSPQFAELLKFQVDRTRKLFEQGRELPELVSGRLKYELRLTWFGGARILERIEQLGYDTLNQRPKISSLDKLRLLARTLLA